MKIATSLSPWLISGGPASGYNTPFNMAFQTEKKYYEWLEEPGNEARLSRFGHAMNGSRYWEVAENIIHGESFYRTFTRFSVRTRKEESVAPFCVRTAARKHEGGD